MIAASEKHRRWLQEQQRELEERERLEREAKARRRADLSAKRSRAGRGRRGKTNRAVIDRHDLLKQLLRIIPSHVSGSGLADMIEKETSWAQLGLSRQTLIADLKKLRRWPQQ